MGINDLIAKDANEYVKLAVKVANDKDYSNSIRNKILNAKSILFRSENATPAWENMLIKINKLSKKIKGKGISKDNKYLGMSYHTNNLMEKEKLLKLANASNPKHANVLIQLGLLGFSKTNLGIGNDKFAYEFFEKSFDSNYVENTTSVNTKQGRWLAFIIGRYNYQLNNYKKAEKFFKLADSSVIDNDDSHKIQLATNITGYPESVEDAKNVIKNYNSRMDKLLNQKDINISFIKSDIYNSCVLSPFNLEIYYEADLKSCMSKYYN